MPISTAHARVNRHYHAEATAVIRSLRLILFLITVMLTSPSVRANVEESSDLVAVALNYLHNHSHSFIGKITLTTEAVDQFDMTSTLIAVYTSEGLVNENGDSHTTISVTTVRAAVEPFQVERIIANGTVYVDLRIEDTPYEQYWHIEPGWWRYDDLRAQYERETYSFRLDNLVQFPLPAQMPMLDADLITAVREGNQRTMDGQAMRVFDVDYNAPHFVRRQTPISSLLANVIDTGDLPAGSELHGSARLWIGSTDMQLYRVEGSSTVYLPFLTSDRGEDIPYDLRDTYNFVFSLSQHGQPAEITPPSSVYAS